MSRHDYRRDTSTAGATPDKRTCPTCRRTFATVGGMRGHHTKTHGTPLPNRTCSGCGTRFYDEKSERKYCESCEPFAGSNNPNWRGGRTTGTCIECQTEFQYYPSEKPGHYCPTCVADDTITCTQPTDQSDARTTTTCSHCSEAIGVFDSTYEDREDVFCDRECYAEWLSTERRNNGVWTAADNPNWHSGINTDGYYGKGWPSARTRALRRDGHSCQRCGAHRDVLDRNPDVHHITPVREFDDPVDAHVLDNLVSLCRPCHIAVERNGASVDDDVDYSAERE